MYGLKIYYDDDIIDIDDISNRLIKQIDKNKRFFTLSISGGGYTFVGQLLGYCIINKYVGDIYISPNIYNNVAYIEKILKNHKEYTQEKSIWLHDKEELDFQITFIADLNDSEDYKKIGQACLIIEDKDNIYIKKQIFNIGYFQNRYQQECICTYLITQYTLFYLQDKFGMFNEIIKRK